MTEPVRLSRRIAEIAGCSRRDAELYIEGGWVRVDGEIVDDPLFKVENERVELHPNATAEPLEPVTLLLNKPAGYGPAEGDRPLLELLEPERRDIADRCPIQTLRNHLRRQTLVTPLDAAAEGLIVFTQDFRTRRRLEEEAHLIEQEILVDVRTKPSDEIVARLNRGGLMFEGKPAPAMKVSRQSETRLRVAVKGYRPGMLADLCAQVGLETVSIRRIRIGRIPMASLPSGKWRFVNTMERF